MKYEYQGIKLGDSIEKIINLLNNENTSFDDFYSYLIYEPGSAIEDITSKIHVYLYTGTVVRIQIFESLLLSLYINKHVFIYIQEL